jgi:AcrR family transcriptional regulator
VSVEPRNLLGRKMGRKAWETRQRIIDAALELLKAHSYKDLSVSEIVSEADVSNATFYVYFKDVQEVLYMCVQAAALDPGELRAIVEAEWTPGNAREQVRRILRKLGSRIARLNPDLEYPQQIAVAIHAAMGALAAQHDIGITSATRQTRTKLNAGVPEILLTLLKV